MFRKLLHFMFPGLRPPGGSAVSAFIDIETLSSQPNAVVFEIGIAIFCRRTFEMRHGREIRLCINEQKAMGRHICEDTLAWHAKKGTTPDFEIGCNLDAGLAELAAIIADFRPHKIWIWGSDFDRPILEDAYRSNSEALPWEYWKTRCARSVWASAFPDLRHTARPHRALEDVALAIEDLENAALRLRLPAAAI